MHGNLPKPLQLVAGNEMKGKASCKQENCRGIITVTESVEDNGYIEWREIRYSMCPSCGEKGYVVEKSVW